MSGLVLLPLYTTFFTLEQFGLLALYEITFEFLQLLSGLGVDNALLRWYWDEKAGYDKKSIFFNANLVSVITSIMIIVLGYFSIYGFSKTIFGENQSLSMITWFILSALSRVLIRQPLLLMRVQQQAVKQTILNITKVVFLIGFSYYTINYLQLGLKGIFMAELFANMLIAPYLIHYSFKNMRLKIEFKLIGEMLRFSLPLVTSWILTLVLTLSDRYIIKYFGNLAEVGIYSLAYKISNVIRVFVVHSFAQAYIPIYYKYMNDPEGEKFYKKSLTYYTFIAVIIALTLTIFGQEAIQIVAKSEEFWASYKLLPYLVIGTIFAGFRQILVLPINKHKKTKVISITNFSAGVINIILNIILVPYTGPVGAALATGLANLFIVGIYYYHVNKLDNIRYEDWKIINAITVCIALSTGAMFVADMDSAPRLIIKALLFVSFPIIMYIMKFYDKDEIGQVKDMIGKYIAKKGK